jgi:hypothetical protein
MPEPFVRCTLIYVSGTGLKSPRVRRVPRLVVCTKKPHWEPLDSSSRFGLRSNPARPLVRLLDGLTYDPLTNSRMGADCLGRVALHYASKFVQAEVHCGLERKRECLRTGGFLLNIGK